MKKGIYLIMVILLATSFVLAACSSSSTPATSVPPSTAPTTSSPGVTTPASTTPIHVSPSPVPTSTTPSQQQYGGILRIINSGGPLTLGDPTLLSDSASIMSAIPALETLVNTNNSGQFHGVLATDWTIAPDGSSITFNLRKGVKFQDGTDFNAQAVKFNLDRYYNVYKTTSPINQWNGIDVLDDYTVRINLKSFQNTIVGSFDGSAGMMISPTAFEKNGADWAKLNPVGTGPYQLKSFSRDVSVEYTRFDDYWGGKPFLDGITFLAVADPTTAELLFKSGGADVISSPSDAVTNDLVNQGYILEKRPGPMMVLVPDSKHSSSPFSDVKVRQAISYAIDRQGICNTLGYGLWEATSQPAAAYQFGHIDDSPYTYNVAKAKELMSESGYPNGFKTSIIATTTFGTQALLVIQSELAAIGINAGLQILEFPAWNNDVSTGWDNALLWAPQGATFTNYVSTLSLYYAGSAVRYPVLAKPAGLDDLINKALSTPDYNTEKDLCQQAVKLIVDNCTTIPVYIAPASYIMTDKVHDTHFDSLAGAGFRWGVTTAWLSK
jgi:ABC-type transport system substrate-binding protein